jgi:hypothetical protein
LYAVLAFTDEKKLRGEVSGTQNLSLVKKLSIDTAKPINHVHEDSTQHLSPSQQAITGTMTPCTYRSENSGLVGFITGNSNELQLPALDVVSPGSLGKNANSSTSGAAQAAQAEDGTEASQQSPFDGVELGVSVRELSIDDRSGVDAEDLFMTSSSHPGAIASP